MEQIITLCQDLNLSDITNEETQIYLDSSHDQDSDTYSSNLSEANLAEVVRLLSTANSTNPDQLILSDCKKLAAAAISTAMSSHGDSTGTYTI